MGAACLTIESKVANTYSQIYIQIVFTVKNVQNLIHENRRVELQKFITGIVAKRGQKLLAIYVMPDHVHIFIGMQPDISISDLTRDIKAGSSKFINSNRWMKGKFNWQEGFGAFSYSKSHAEKVVKYILNQKEHHKKKTFREEYIEFLNKFAIKYDEKYLFDWIDQQDAPTEL